MRFLRPSCLVPVLLLAACGYSQNDPYPADERGTNTLYSAFTERPKHLDPARSYSEDESVFTAQVYEAPLQYHYLKRPYTLIPAAAEVVPHPRYFDAAGKALPDDAPAERIDSLHFQCGIEFSQGHRHGVGTEQLEGLDMRGAARCTLPTEYINRNRRLQQ